MENQIRIFYHTVLGFREIDFDLSKKCGIPLPELKRLRRNHRYQRESILENKKIKITDPYWHLHSLHEIFGEELYRFDPESENPYILDCGSNIGLSIVFFRRNYPGARIIAFEPDPTIFGYMKENLNILGIEDIELHKKAVWVEDKSLPFAATGSLGGSLDIEAIRAKSVSPVIQCEAVRLRNFLSQTVDFLKLDIEGAESEVLQDCSDRLGFVKNLFVEYHSNPEKPQQLSEILTILEKNGFRYYIKEAWNNMGKPFLFKNYRPFWDLQLNIFAYRKD